MLSGIYQILNTVNGKLYIGSAVNLEKRQYEHFYRLRANTHTNKHLQAAFNKYGESNFVFSILYKTTQLEALTDIEQLYIDNYDFEKDLYNICPTAGSLLNHKHTEETKEVLRQKRALQKNPRHTEQSKKRLSNALRGNKNGLGIKISKEHKAKISKIKSVSVQQIDCNTLEVIKTWDSMIAAASELNINVSNISRVCTNKRKTCGGFVWKYAI